MARRAPRRGAGIAVLSHYLPACSVSTEVLRAAWGGGGPHDVTALPIADIDEDALTMAAAAGAGALAQARTRPGAIPSVRLVIPPGCEAPASTLAEALDLSSASWRTIIGGSAATLRAIVDAAMESTMGGEPSLVIAACDWLPSPSEWASRLYGHGAGAALLTPTGGLLVEGSSFRSNEHLGAERRSSGDPRVRLPVDQADPTEPLIGAVARAQWRSETSRLLLCTPSTRTARRLATAIHPKALKVLSEGIGRWCGDLGPAGPLVALAGLAGSLLPREDVVVAGAGFGQGGALRLHRRGSVRATGGVTDEASVQRHEIDPMQVLQQREMLRALDPPSEAPMGAYVSMPAHHDSSAARYRLVGERGVRSGTIHFPPRGPIMERATGEECTPVRLRGTGTIYALTTIGRGGAPGEFSYQQQMDGPYHVALVQLSEGPRIIAQLTPSWMETPTIGTPVVSVLRRLYRQQGIQRYGLKFTTVEPVAGPRAPIRDPLAAGS